MDVIATFGKELRKPDGSMVSTSDALGSKEVVALYFSAHWCPPCRGFTPTLCEKYTALKAAGKDFEMIFVSSDKDDAAFTEYADSMTFLALPFAERDLKNKLSKKFKVSGIPSLVFFDLKNNKIITDEGRDEVTSDKFIENFPYRTAPVDVIATLGKELRKPNSEGSKVATADAVKGKVLALYFSAHWCPPCRGFTPTLCEKYTALKAAGTDFEMIFVSSDRDEAAFTEYADSMTFLALPYAEREAKDKLSKHFKVNGIPSLVLIDADGKLITANGRGGITSETFVEDFPYHPKALNDLSGSTDGINESVCLVVVMDQTDSATQTDLSATLTKLAEQELAKPEDDRAVEKFFTGCGGGPLDQVKKGCGYGDLGDKKEPVMLILDLGDEGAYYHPEEGKAEVTEANIAAFAAAVKKGALTRKTFGK